MFLGRNKEFPLDIKSNDFAIRAITILGQGLQSARNSRYMDSFAVAIQVLLYIYIHINKSITNYLLLIIRKFYKFIM